MAKHAFIQDLKPNQLLDSTYAMHNCQLGQTKTGKPYIKCLLGDRTGQLPARMWNVSAQLFEALPTDGFVAIEGQTQPYQGQLQIIVQRIAVAEPTEQQLADLLPRSDRDPAEMFEELKRVLEWVKDPGIKALLDQYLADEALMARFRQSPAAMMLHHAYLGGLLEHTLSVLRLAELICPLYPQLNQDLVMAGLFLHDLGKCRELTWTTVFSYTDDGQLVGHVGRGMLWLEEKARACAEAGTPVPEAVLRVLHHILLSHHGQPEFGALKLPATPEAWAVHLLDNVDAKLHMAIAATRGENAPPMRDADLGGHFTDKVWALGTRLYRPDPTKLDE